MQALLFQRCDGLQISGLTHINGPGFHIYIVHSQDVTISNINIHSPIESHNTDGIDISNSQRVNIHGSVIGTGMNTHTHTSTFILELSFPLVLLVSCFPLSWFHDFNAMVACMYDIMIQVTTALLSKVAQDSSTLATLHVVLVMALGLSLHI